VLLAAGVLAPAAEAAPPRVDAMIVHRSGATTGPQRVAVGAVRVRRCRVGEGLPIGVLSALRVSFGATGSCGSLYVNRIGRQRASGAQGWVFKVGRRIPSRGASDPSTALRSGQRIVWFWCVRAGACQRTLAMQAPRTTRRARTFRVVVRGYDDSGRGRRVRGAAIRYDGRVARTNRRGVATLRALRPGRLRLVAVRRGMVRSFPSTVVVR
jgi:hypothetical protein